MYHHKSLLKDMELRPTPADLMVSYYVTGCRVCVALWSISTDRLTPENTGSFIINVSRYLYSSLATPLLDGPRKGRFAAVGQGHDVKKKWKTRLIPIE
jgi:hypothetical protein